MLKGHFIRAHKIITTRYNIVMNPEPEGSSVQSNFVLLMLGEEQVGQPQLNTRHVLAELGYYDTALLRDVLEEAFPDIDTDKLISRIEYAGSLLKTHHHPEPQAAEEEIETI